jgi:hypothetical protein
MTAITLHPFRPLAAANRRLAAPSEFGVAPLRLDSCVLARLARFKPGYTAAA